MRISHIFSIITAVVLTTHLPSSSAAQQPSIPYDETFNVQFFGWARDIGTPNAVSFMVVHKITSINSKNHVCGAFRGTPLTAAARRFIHRGKVVSSTGQVLRKGLNGFQPLPVTIKTDNFIALPLEKRRPAMTREYMRAHSVEAALGLPVYCHALKPEFSAMPVTGVSEIILNKMVVEYMIRE